MLFHWTTTRGRALTFYIHLPHQRVRALLKIVFILKRSMIVSLLQLNGNGHGTVTDHFPKWREDSHLQLNRSKTKDMAIDFRRENLLTKLSLYSTCITSMHPINLRLWHVNFESLWNMKHFFFGNCLVSFCLQPICYVSVSKWWPHWYGMRASSGREWREPKNLKRTVDAQQLVRKDGPTLVCARGKQNYWTRAEKKSQ